MTRRAPMHMPDPIRREERAQSLAAAVAEITRIAAPHQAAGFYGQLRLALELQDGIVVVVRNRGHKEAKKVWPPKSERRAA